MLKLILDTNLFRADLKGLEIYKFNSLYENLIELVKTTKIQDVQLCFTETGLMEYINQVGNYYQKFVIEDFNRIYEIVKSSMPINKLYFTSKENFEMEYYEGLKERLKELNIKIIPTLPIFQEGGMDMEDVLNKTIKDIAPFNKQSNKNLKDAFISESVNSEAKSLKNHNYLFITCNWKDFKENKEKEDNYKIEFMVNDSTNNMFELLRILKNNSVYVDDEVFYEQFVHSKHVKETIKQFLEIDIIEGQFYKEVPEIKMIDDTHYSLSHEIEEDNIVNVKFKIVDNSKEYDAGIIFNLNKKLNDKKIVINKYINYIDDFGEGVYYDEF